MTKDMTSGAITPLLIKFTIPLVLGNLFQLTYNAADSIARATYGGIRHWPTIHLCTHHLYHSATQLCGKG